VTWLRSEGNSTTLPLITTAPSPATTKKGARQPTCSASQSPAGTPNTDATEKAPITVPIALPRLCGGMVSAMMAKHSDVAGPPKAPATLRASNRVVKSPARPQSAVPTVRPATATPTAFRRSKRSRNSAPSSPASEAVAV
jgi:hypothetical protein